MFGDRAVEKYLPFARHVARGPSARRSLPAGYGIKPGMRVLLVVDSYHDELVVEVICRAIREEGATVDLFKADMGPDREVDELDEVRTFIGNSQWGKEPIEPPAWRREIETFTEKMGYDLLVSGLGGPTPKTPSYRDEGIPWVSRELLPAVLFPDELWDLIQRKAWAPIWEHGRGGRVRVTDPEGTDLSFTFLEEHFANPRDGFGKEPCWGHLHGHPLPPYGEKENAAGVVAGTMNHCGRPFPHIEVYVERGQIERIEGGGEYGDAWRQLLDATRDIQYPEYPRPGLFWLWETAIGTNPKAIRLHNVLMRSRTTFWDRLRSGIIHVGFGTRIMSPSEDWARVRGVPFGHLHVHLCFPTYELTSKAGKKFTIIDHGRLTSLDDPDVVLLAAKYGNPKDLLREDWIPRIPGITAPGDYLRDYARDPASYIKAEGSRPRAGAGTRRRGRLKRGGVPVS